MKFETSKVVSDKVISQYCPTANSGIKVSVLKNSKGEIGGYKINMPVDDTPIPYLDANGQQIASFHIFDTDENKAAASKIISQLTSEFPVEEPLKCPWFASKYIAKLKNSSSKY